MEWSGARIIQPWVAASIQASSWGAFKTMERSLDVRFDVRLYARTRRRRCSRSVIPMPAAKPSAAEITTAPSAEAIPEAANRTDQLRR